MLRVNVGNREDYTQLIIKQIIVKHLKKLFLPFFLPTAVPRTYLYLPYFSFADRYTLFFIADSTVQQHFICDWQGLLRQQEDLLAERPSLYNFIFNKKILNVRKRKASIARSYHTYQVSLVSAHQGVASLPWSNRKFLSVLRSRDILLCEGITMAILPQICSSLSTLKRTKTVRLKSLHVGRLIHSRRADQTEGLQAHHRTLTPQYRGLLSQIKIQIIKPRKL